MPLQVLIKKKAPNPWHVQEVSGVSMSVDPGITGTGWAIWDNKSWDKLCAPVKSGSIQSYNGKTWEAKIDNIGAHLADVCSLYHVNTGYIELPQFEQSERGIAAARDGSLVKLCMMAGAIQGRCFQCTRSPYFLEGNKVTSFFAVPVNTWKGQLSKEICHQRIRTKLPFLQTEGNTTHEMDAIGLGLFVKGFF